MAIKIYSILWQSKSTLGLASSTKNSRGIYVLAICGAWIILCSRPSKASWQHSGRPLPSAVFQVIMSPLGSRRSPILRMPPSMRRRWFFTRRRLPPFPIWFTWGLQSGSSLHSSVFVGWLGSSFFCKNSQFLHRPCHVAEPSTFTCPQFVTSHVILF